MADIYDKFINRLPGKILQDIKSKEKLEKLTTAELTKVLEKVVVEFEKSKVVPGEAVGLVTAESFGESGTQMTLDVFHFAGVSELQVTSGLPRLIELFDARKIPKTPEMEVHILSKYTKTEKEIRKVASKLKELTLQDISTEFSLNLMKGNIEVRLDLEKVKDFGFTIDEIEKTLKEKLKKVNVRKLTHGFVFEAPEGVFELTELHKVKEKVKEVVIRGIAGITQVLPVKVGSKTIVKCAGSNVKDVLAMEEVDSKNVTSNNLFEILASLGIEAARQTLINEGLSIIEGQGLDVDVRHMLLLADLMTNTGSLKGITRGGIAGEKGSVLARASFETPIPHIINASISGEVDELKSVIENVMVNQPVPMGTGLPNLVFGSEKKTKELKTEDKKEIKEKIKK
jgi:DNA-directed RNA polymerase subunit A"